MYKRDGTKMRKNFKFDKLDEWIKAEYDRETKGIEDSLSDDGSFDPNKIDSQELYQRIQYRIKEKEEQETKSEVQEKRRGITRQRVGKCAAFFCTAVTGVFLASMTSEANRSYFMYKMQYLIGDEVVANEGNGDDKSSTIQSKEENQVKQEIDEKLDIAMPSFLYKLQLEVDNKYNIQYGNDTVIVKFKYNNIIVNLRMYNKNYTDISGVDIQGEIIKELKLKEGTISAVVVKIEALQDEEPTLTAQWEYGNGFYQLSGKMEEGEFIKILESITY